MTAHPLDLIAGISDGTDIEEREGLDDHIASCDSCRTYARAIERVDRLITSPEPALALPRRATVARPRGHAMTVLAAVVAGVVLLVVASVMRQSLQPAAARPAWAEMTALGNDACDLVPAARTVRVIEPPRSPFPKVPPLSPFGPFHGECVYGYQEGWFAFHLLMRSEPTPLAEAVQQWRWFLAFQDPPLLSWNTSDEPGPGGVSAVRWSTTGVTAGRQWSMIGVAAESYFFVVTAETTDRASKFANAMLDQLRQRPWPADAWQSSACMVIDRAAADGGLSAPPSPQPAALFPHVGVNSPDFGNNVCAYGRDDGAWTDPHLFLRAGTTTSDEVARLLSDAFVAVSPSDRVDEWTLVGDDMWLAHGRQTNPPQFSAVAGLSGSRFFMVTLDTDESALRLARAIAAVLKP